MFTRTSVKVLKGFFVKNPSALTPFIKLFYIPLLKKIIYIKRDFIKC